MRHSQGYGFGHTPVVSWRLFGVLRLRVGALDRNVLIAHFERALMAHVDADLSLALGFLLAEVKHHVHGFSRRDPRIFGAAKRSVVMVAELEAGAECLLADVGYLEGDLEAAVAPDRFHGAGVNLDRVRHVAFDLTDPRAN